MPKRALLPHFLWPVVALATLTPWVSSGMALMMGIALALLLENPYSQVVKKWTHRCLSLSVMGLGAGMNLSVIGQVGYAGLGYTITGIVSALLLGRLLGQWLRVPGNTSLLISVGTAICGGSAIAAVAPVIRAKSHEVSVALATVFTLNALALVSFPWIGHLFSMSESQFGLWSALAIHDTSSVVGATLLYGPQALAIGTTVKLARALWIIPVATAIGFYWAKKNETEPSFQDRAPKPWFILGFILAAALVTWLPELTRAGHAVESVAKNLMVLTLFLIGSSLNRAAILSVGWKPFAQGTLLWILMAAGSFAALQFGLIS